MGKQKATKPNQTERAGKLDQLMDELPIKRRAKIEARASELGLPADRRRATALETLRAEVCKGLASGKSKPAEEVLGRLERKYASLAAGRSRK